MAKVTQSKNCKTCGIEKTSRYFKKGSDHCTACVSSNLVIQKKVLEPVLELLDPVVAPQFPEVEINYADPTAQELAARTLARRNLLAFVKRFRPKYMAGWVHEDLCRRLVQFMQAIERGESPRLLIMMPPRSGKSELASRNFPGFMLGHHPDWEIIAASNAQSLATSFSRYIRDQLRDPSYQALFPDTQLDQASQSVENWNLTHGGGYLAAGIGTAIVGRGAHCLIIDDPVRDIEAADSQLQRDATWEWYGSTAYTRLAPGGGVLGILTWWNEDDWAGRIQQVMQSGEGDVFEIVRYPAINDEGDEYLLADDTMVQIPDGQPVPEDAKMTRPKDTALHPERYNTKAMLAIKANFYASGQQRLWAALYQQNPTPSDGMTFTKRMFRTYSHTPQTYERNIYQAWDFAITTKQASDYTVGITVLHDENDDIYILDVNRFRSGDGEDIMKTVVEYAQAWNATTVGFEDGQIWKSLESSFKRICQEKQHYPSYEILQPLTDKQVRAQPLRGRMQAGKVWFPERAPWYEALRSEMLRFPAGKHDDQVDALAWVVRLILKKSPPKLTVPKPLPSWKDKLKSIMAGQVGGSHMAS